MKTISQFKEALSLTKEAVEELPDGEIKVKAFEVILQHLLRSNVSMNLDYGTSHENARKKAITESAPKANGESG